MSIKLKNIPDINQFDPLQKHLENILSPSKQNMGYAKKRLEAACMASDLIKKNIDIPEKISKESDPLKTAEAKANLIVLSTVIDNIGQTNLETQQKSINEYLSKQAELRNENQLVYGKSLSNSNLIGLGMGLAETPENSNGVFYKKKLISTDTYTYRGDQYAIQGTVEFGITYDNKIFIVPKFDGITINNLYKMAQGVFLKAVGCIQIGNKEIEESMVDGKTFSKILEGHVKYISIYNRFFDAPKDNIAVSLYALKGMGIDLSDAQVVIPDDKAPLISRYSGCNITIHGNIKNASYYLDEVRFPGAKALAEKKSNFSDKLVELFCAIDDEILLTRNKKLIKDIIEERALLKLNLIRLFSCTEGLIQSPENNSQRVEVPGLLKDINQPSTSKSRVEQVSVSAIKAEETVTGTFNDYWQAIKASMQLFKEKNIDLSFLASEINMIVAYLLQSSLTSEEKQQLKEWVISVSVPGRKFELEPLSDYIKFYEHDPIKTCIALLQDYSKGSGWQGMICRFFSGAWNRNYKDPVNKFLSIYKKNELADNINICSIYDKLKDLGLIFNYDAESKSSLRKILLFCAKLNNEEESLLHLILNLSYTAFPPLDSDTHIECCC
ncbi:MAG: hypothetical protein E6K54_04900 [Gammaproteobacteria bacterium]|nr:MAG: hypothetical protein E6K54_04900 [Gammaproteobacteria bacterium]